MSEQANIRRRQLLDIARRRFVADGYSKTSIASIVRAAGVAQGTFYLYFDSKQSVLIELRREVFSRYEAALTGLWQASSPPPDEKMARAVEAMVRILREELPLERVFREAESAEATQRAAMRGKAKLASSARAIVEIGIAEGVFCPCDTELVARMVVTLFDNLLYEALTYEDSRQLQRVATEGLRFTLRGLRTPDDRIDAVCATLDLSSPTEDAECPS